MRGSPFLFLMCMVVALVLVPAVQAAPTHTENATAYDQQATQYADSGNWGAACYYQELANMELMMQIVLGNTTPSSNTDTVVTIATETEHHYQSPSESPGVTQTINAAASII
jgi:hypothetical protein